MIKKFGKFILESISEERSLDLFDTPQKIVGVREIFDYDSYYDGFLIKLTDYDLYLVISNGQDCCEEFGYVSSEDDFTDFIGAEVKMVVETDSKLNNRIIDAIGNNEEETNAFFITFETNKGPLQFALYNIHNGYYGHGYKMFLKDRDGKEMIVADSSL